MLHFLKSYLKFLWKSKNEHGVHSPFIYDLATKCFYDKTIYPEYSFLKKYRKSLLTNKNFIEVKDISASSQVFKSNKKQISKISKTKRISSKQAELLFRIVRYFQPESILVIGNSLGLATLALSLGKPNSKIISLDNCKKRSTISNEMFQVSNFKFQEAQVKFINTEFLIYLNSEILNSKLLNLIYINGNKSKKATLEYFELLLPTITNDSVWIFDDIHWSREIENAWKIIQKHPKVKVTIDTFQYGIVFFRSEQEKEHFVIRV